MKKHVFKMCERVAKSVELAGEYMNAMTQSEYTLYKNSYVLKDLQDKEHARFPPFNTLVWTVVTGE